MQIFVVIDGFVEDDKSLTSRNAEVHVRRFEKTAEVVDVSKNVEGKTTVVKEFSWNDNLARILLHQIYSLIAFAYKG